MVKKIARVVCVLSMCVAVMAAGRAFAAEQVYAVHLQVLRGDELLNDITTRTTSIADPVIIRNTVDHPYVSAATRSDSSKNWVASETSSYQTGTVAKIGISDVGGASNRVNVHVEFSGTDEIESASQTGIPVLKLPQLRNTMIDQATVAELGETLHFGGHVDGGANYQIKLTVNRND